MITRDKLSVLQKGLGLDEAAYIESEHNRFYLTGFAASDGFCLVTNNDLLFFTDFRYIEAAQNNVKYFTVSEEKGRKRLSTVAEILNERGIKKLNVEAQTTSLSDYARMKEQLPDVKIISDGALDKIILKFREIKTDEEIKLISTAASISDKAFMRLLDRIKPGVSERELTAELEYLLKLEGGDGLAFETIVVSGENTSMPHGVPGNRRIGKGDFITFDFGAIYNGYLSDMTRTIAVGYVSDEQKNVYSTVLKAQLTSLKAIHPGAVCKDVDAIARKIIADAGYDKCFGHGLGHCVGIEIHEMPSLSPACEVILEQNHVITCEPGVYLNGKFGVRIEDLVVVTDNGAKVLNAVPKELIIL